MLGFRKIPSNRILPEIWAHHYISRTLTANIRSRRGSKVAINLPIYIDEKTPRPFIDPTIPYDRNIYPEDPGAVTSNYLAS